MDLPWTLAATSWLWPLPLAENLRRIAALDLPISQVGLLFYQTAPSLAYTAQDLPAQPGLSAHVHLPLDLPWPDGPQVVWACIRRLMDTASPLAPWAGVLHPPDDPAVLTGVARLWRDTAPPWRLLLENVPGQDLRRHWPAVLALDIPLCLDVGHLMAFGQEWLLADPEVLTRTEMLHCYAPGLEPGRHAHLPLTALTPEQADIVRWIVSGLRREAVVLFEVFCESDLRLSLDAFYALASSGRFMP
jgi:hypothetical protein